VYPAAPQASETDTHGVPSSLHPLSDLTRLESPILAEINSETETFHFSLNSPILSVTPIGIEDGIFTRVDPIW